MTYEEVKEVLHTYLKLNRLVKLKKQQLDWAREDSGTLSGIDYSRPRTSGGLPQSVVERAVERVDRLAHEYADVCDKMFEAEDKIARMLPLLNADEQALIIERYMNGFDLKQLSKKYYYADGSLKVKFNRIYKKLTDNRC